MKKAESERGSHWAARSLEGTKPGHQARTQPRLGSRVQASLSFCHPRLCVCRGRTAQNPLLIHPSATCAPPQPPRPTWDICSEVHQGWLQNHKCDSELSKGSARNPGDTETDDSGSSYFNCALYVVVSCSDATETSSVAAAICFATSRPPRFSEPSVGAHCLHLRADPERELLCFIRGRELIILQKGKRFNTEISALSPLIRETRKKCREITPPGWTSLWHCVLVVG